MIGAALLSRVQALEAKVGSTPPVVQTKAASTTASSASSGGWHLHELDGTQVINHTNNTTGSWATWTLSSQVPTTATHVLIESWSFQHQPDGVGVMSFLYFRKNAAAPQRIGCAGKASGSSDNTGSANQGIYAISSIATIDYNASSDFDDWQCKLIGYFG